LLPLVHRAPQAHPGTGIELVETRRDERTLEPLADDLEPVWVAEATGDVGGADQHVVALDRSQAADRDDERLCFLGDGAGGVAGVDAIGDDPYPTRRQPELVH